MAFKTLFFFLLFACANKLFAQNTTKPVVITFHPEVLAGHIVPNYPKYPFSGALYGVGLSLRKKQPKGLWKAKFPQAQTGIYLGYWNMGNDSIFGSELTAYPFVQFPIKHYSKSTLDIRIGLGLAHFSKHYSASENHQNIAVGSSFTWAFETSLYWTKPISSSLDLTLAGKYLHGSNGHTQLPNFGINSAAISFGLLFLPKRTAQEPYTTVKEPSKAHILQIFTGFGLQEYGGTDGPVGGPKYGVQSLAAYWNTRYNHRNQLKLGFIFRHYNSFGDYINRHDLDSKITANSFSLVLGHEFLMGRIGLDVDGLLQLYKPFYKTYFDSFGSDSRFLWFVHRYLGARIGFNAYAIAPAKQPKFNLFLGVHLNTNNGEADFSSVCLGLETAL